MARKSGRRDLSWLKPMWDRKKRETADRVTRAVTHLIKTKRPVTLAAIRETVEALFSASISTNTIQRNEEAYAVYLQHRAHPAPVRAKNAALRALLAAEGGEKRSAALRARIDRLRRESKDALIARIIELEKSAEQHARREDNLREEILRLTLGPRQKGSNK